MSSSSVAGNAATLPTISVSFVLRSPPSSYTNDILAVWHWSVTQQQYNDFRDSVSASIGQQEEYDVFANYYSTEADRSRRVYFDLQREYNSLIAASPTSTAPSHIILNYSSDNYKYKLTFHFPSNPLVFRNLFVHYFGADLLRHHRLE